MIRVTPSFIKKIAKGTIFSIHYKRADGTEGVMCCRFGVKKYLKNPSAPRVVDSSAEEKDYITVFNCQKKGYRRVKIENIISMKVRGLRIDLRDLYSLSVAANARIVSEVMSNGFDAPKYQAIPSNYSAFEDEFLVA